MNEVPAAIEALNKLRRHLETTSYHIGKNRLFDLVDEAMEALQPAVPTAQAREPMSARPLSEYHEDHGPVVWWSFPVCEPAWIGTPTDSDWPGYHTHWTPHPDVPGIGTDKPTGGA